MDGVLVIDKPRGPTSHDVVSQVRRALNIKKVGHTGTLDPVATGVLPLVLGGATKLARYIAGGDKTYVATFTLGSTTRTLDSEGEVLQRRPVQVELEQLQEVLAGFVGDITQMPPMYSAKKVDGVRLYELARQGVEVERQSKQVKIHFIRLLTFSSPQLTLEVRCSAGTYVRVLAQDVGEHLGCGAYLESLRRVAAAPFGQEDAISLQAVLDDPELASQSIVPVSRALTGLPRMDIPADIARMVVAGYQLSVADLRALDTPAFEVDEALTLGVEGGDVMAVVRTQMASSEMPRSRRDRRALKTERVFKTSLHRR